MAKINLETAQRAIDEFEFMLSFGMGVERACTRVERAPRSILRYYAALGKRAPGGLATLDGSGPRKASS